MAGFSVEYVRFSNRAKEYFECMAKNMGRALCWRAFVCVCAAMLQTFLEPARILLKRESGFSMQREETPGAVWGFRERRPPTTTRRRLPWQSKGYDHQLVDQSAEKIVQTAQRTGARVSGPVPLPTEKQVITILRAVHKYKDSREQFEMRTHKRLIDILRPSNKTVEALMSLELPAGVDIEIKL